MTKKRKRAASNKGKTSSSSSSSSSSSAPTIKRVDYKSEWQLELSQASTGIEDLMQNCICLICQQIAWNPMVNMKCKCNQMVCRSCLNRYYVDAPREDDSDVDDPLMVPGTLPCLKCKTPHMEATDYAPVSGIALSILNRLRIKCPAYAHAGCTWVGEYSQAKDHSDRTCPFRVGECLKCGHFYKQTELKQHDETCRRTVRCDQCLKSVYESNLTHHKKDRCSQSIMCCPNGCTIPADASISTSMPLRYIRQREKLHKDTCPKQIVVCPLWDRCRALPMTREAMWEHLKDVQVHIPHGFEEKGVFALAISGTVFDLIEELCQTVRTKLLTVHDSLMAKWQLQQQAMGCCPAGHFMVCRWGNEQQVQPTTTTTTSTRLRCHRCRCRISSHPMSVFYQCTTCTESYQCCMKCLCRPIELGAEQWTWIQNQLVEIEEDDDTHEIRMLVPNSISSVVPIHMNGPPSASFMTAIQALQELNPPNTVPPALPTLPPPPQPTNTPVNASNPNPTLPSNT